MTNDYDDRSRTHLSIVAIPLAWCWFGKIKLFGSYSGGRSAISFLSSLSKNR
jgi:hypothetical protein